MNFSFARIHLRLFAILFMVIAIILTVTLSLGELKPEADIDLIDAIGEGGMTLVTLVWIGFTVLSRPAGRVTNLLFAGLTVMHVSMLLDLLDEFLHYPEAGAWLTTIESLPAPIGMIMMTFALYHWHREQMTINAGLKKKERYYREHSLTDFVTGLYSADYMKNQIEHEIRRDRKDSPFCLLMLDIRQFDDFNRRFGHGRGDVLLKEFAELLLLNLRQCDLVCRFASDRFIVLLPKTRVHQAELIARQLQTSVSHLAHRPDNTNQAVYHHIYAAVSEYRQGQSAQGLLTGLSEQIAGQKLALQGAA